MSARKLVFIFVLALLVFSVIKTPAALIASQITLPNNVAYQGLSGSVWQGNISKLKVDQWLLNDVEWTVSPANLFLGEAAIDVRFGKARDKSQISGKGRLLLSMSDVAAEKLTVRLPADPLKRMLPIPVGNLGGRVLLDIEAYQKGETLCNQLTGELTWAKSEIDFGGPVSLGSISSELSCVNNNIVASFDGNNQLGLEGAATVQSTAKYNFDGFLKPDAQLPAAIHEGLRMFGKADSKGKYRIKI